MDVGDARALAVEVVERDVGDLEVQRAAIAQAGGDQILDDLLLAVDRDRAAGQLGHVDVLRATGLAQVDAAVLEALAREPLADTELGQQLDGVLLEQAGAHALLDVRARTALEHDRLDARALQHQRERQPGRPGADDADLRAHAASIDNRNSSGVRAARGRGGVRALLRTTRPSRPAPTRTAARPWRVRSRETRRGTGET